MKKVYLFYRDNTWKLTNIKDIGSVKNIKFVLVPLLGTKDPIYIPVDATFVKEFHHGSIAMTIRNTVMIYDDLSDSQMHLFSKTQKFNDVIEYVNYIHSVYRLRGFEMLRQDGYSECPGVSTMYDIFELIADAYDSDGELITKVKYKSKTSPYELFREESLSIGRLYQSVLKKLENIIVSIETVPIDDNLFQLHANGTYSHVVTSKYYGTNQFFFFPNMHLFYFEKRDAIEDLYDLIRRTIKFSFALYTIDSSQNPEMAELSLEEINEHVVDGSITYYDVLWWDDLYFSHLLEMLVCLPIMLQYIKFETMSVVFESDTSNIPSAFTNLVRVEFQMDNRHNYQLLTTPNRFKTLHGFLKGILKQ